MTKNQVTTGNVYLAKVSGILAPVRLLEESRFGGWVGRNENTGRNVRVKTAGRLRYQLARCECCGHWHRDGRPCVYCREVGQIVEARP